MLSPEQKDRVLDEVAAIATELKFKGDKDGQISRYLGDIAKPK
jgi:hypothetical protein